MFNMLFHLKPPLELTSDEGRVRGPGGRRPLAQVLPAGAAHNLHITRAHQVNTANPTSVSSPSSVSSHSAQAS